jgi:transposase
MTVHSTERGDHVGKNVSYRDILRHRANRMSQRQIASACGCARSTVQDVLKKADENGVSWEDVAGLSESAAYELIRGRPQQSSEFAAIDYGRVKAEMDRDHTMTLTILWEEYAMLAARNKERAYGYSRFCERYADWCDEHDVAVTRKFIPGDLGEFDWNLPVSSGKFQSTSMTWPGLCSRWLVTLCEAT